MLCISLACNNTSVACPPVLQPLQAVFATALDQLMHSSGIAWTAAHWLLALVAHQLLGYMVQVLLPPAFMAVVTLYQLVASAVCQFWACCKQLQIYMATRWWVWLAKSLLCTLACAEALSALLHSSGTFSWQSCKQLRISVSQSLRLWALDCLVPTFNRAGALAALVGTSASQLWERCKRVPGKICTSVQRCPDRCLLRILRSTGALKALDAEHKAEMAQLRQQHAEQLQVMQRACVTALETQAQLSTAGLNACIEQHARLMLQQGCTIAQQLLQQLQAVYLGLQQAFQQEQQQLQGQHTALQQDYQALQSSYGSVLQQLHDLQEQVPAPEQQGNLDALVQQVLGMQEYASGLLHTCTVAQEAVGLLTADRDALQASLCTSQTAAATNAVDHAAQNQVWTHTVNGLVNQAEELRQMLHPVHPAEVAHI